jgi:hypothetical protein
MPNTTDLNENDAEKLARLLELELIQKRTVWKQAGTRYRTIRTFCFLFLFILIVAGAFGFYFIFARVNEERTNQRNSSTPVSSQP